MSLFVEGVLFEIEGLLLETFLLLCLFLEGFLIVSV